MSAAAGAAVLRLATRGSALARAQAALAADALQRATGRECELVVVRTTGDRRGDVPLGRLEGQGWFTAELERALLDGAADVAVHSAKDLPTTATPGLLVAAHLPRADPRDGAVTRDGRALAELPAGAVVATSSARRVALLQAQFPQIRTAPIRGNVDTRLRKLDRGEVDSLLVACAGLDRLGLGERLQRLDAEVFVPAPAQGAIALQCRAQSEPAELCAGLDDADTAAAVTAERTTLAALGGGCLLPLGAWARVDGGALRLTAALHDGAALRRAESRGDRSDPEALGRAVAEALR